MGFQRIPVVCSAGIIASWSSLQGSSGETRPEPWHVIERLLHKPDSKGPMARAAEARVPTSVCRIQINNMPRTGPRQRQRQHTWMSLGDNCLFYKQKKRACPRTSTATAVHALLRRSLMHSMTCSLSLSPADDHGAGHAPVTTV